MQNRHRKCEIFPINPLIYNHQTVSHVKASDIQRGRGKEHTPLIHSTCSLSNICLRSGYSITDFWNILSSLLLLLILRLTSELINSGCFDQGRKSLRLIKQGQWSQGKMWAMESLQECMPLREAEAAYLCQMGVRLKVFQQQEPSHSDYNKGLKIYSSCRDEAWKIQEQVNLW